MTKKWTETVKPWPEIARKKAHRVRVTNIGKVAAPKALRVTFQFLEEPQVDRPLDVRLSLPIRESGLTAEFFRACGLDIFANAQIAPRTVINTTLNVRFTKGQSSDEYNATGFQSVKEDHEDGLTKCQS